MTDEFARYIEKMVQSAIKKRELGSVLDSLEILGFHGLRYECERDCSGILNVAVYRPKEDTMITLDVEEMQTIDKGLLKKGLLEAKNNEVFYKSGSTCAHFYSRGFWNMKEGFIPMVKFEGWSNEVSEELKDIDYFDMRITDVKFYGQGHWNGENKENRCPYFKKHLKVPKNAVIKNLTFEEIIERVRQKFSAAITNRKK